MKIARFGLVAAVAVSLAASAFAAEAPKTPPPAPTLVPVKLVIANITGRGQDVNTAVNTSRYEGDAQLTIGENTKPVRVVVEARTVKGGANKAVVEGALIVREKGESRGSTKRLNLIVTGDTLAGWAEGEQVMPNPVPGFRPVANLKATVTGGVSSTGALSLTLDGFLVLRPVEGDAK